MACSCITETNPRVMLAGVDVAFVGRVVAEQSVPGSPSGTDATTFEVLRVYKGEMRPGERVVVSTTAVWDGGASCVGRAWKSGDQGAVVAEKSEGRLEQASLCQQMTESDMRAAVKPLPPVAASPGKAVVLASTGLAGSGVVALDERGQVAGYGASEQPVERFSVCPGGKRVIEAMPLSGGGAKRKLATRDLRTLEIVGSWSPAAPDGFVCSSPDGTRVVGVLEDGPTRRIVEQTKTRRKVIVRVTSKVAALSPIRALLASFTPDDTERYHVLDLRTRKRRSIKGVTGMESGGVDPAGRYALFNNDPFASRAPDYYRLVDLARPGDPGPRLPGSAFSSDIDLFYAVVDFRDATIVRSDGTPLARLRLPKMTATRTLVGLGERMIYLRGRKLWVSGPVATGGRLAFGAPFEIPLTVSDVIALPTAVRVAARPPAATTSAGASGGIAGSRCPGLR